MSDVFISHVEEDKCIALELADGLDRSGYSTWLYERDSVPGLSYLVQTGEAIEHSLAVILIVSAHSVTSNQVSSEVVRAHEAGKPFLPVLCNVTHAQFQSQQPLWRQAVGSAASVELPAQGVVAILPRIIAGLMALGVKPSPTTTDQKPRNSGVGDERPRRISHELGRDREKPGVAGRRWLLALGLVVGIQAIVILGLLLRLWRLPEGSSVKQPGASSTPTSISRVTPPSVAVGPTLTRSPASVQPSPTASRRPSATPTSAKPAVRATTTVYVSSDAVKAYELPLSDPSRVFYDGQFYCVSFSREQLKLQLDEARQRFEPVGGECNYPKYYEISWDDSRRQFWTVTGGVIALADESWTVKLRFSVPSTFLGTPEHVVWDGEFLWVASSAGLLYKMQAPSTGEELLLLDWHKDRHGVLVFDGKDLWVLTAGEQSSGVNNSKNSVTKLNRSGDLVCVVELPDINMRQYWSGLDWDGRFLWARNPHVGYLYRIDPSDCP